MAYAFGADDLKFVTAMATKTGHVRMLFECPTLFPRYYLLSQAEVSSLSVDQESQNFDMGFFQLRGPVFYVRKEDFVLEDLIGELDDQRYVTRLPGF